MNILIVEDDDTPRLLLSSVLTRLGHDVRGGENSFFVTHWMMPGLDGIEICRAIRSAGLHVYVIMVTARGSKENIAEGLGAGADDYLVKPFDKDELHVRILVGLRVMALQATLDDRLKKLDVAAAELTDLKQQYAL